MGLSGHSASRIKVRDVRHLAYEEHGVPRDAAKYKIIQVHGFYSCRLDSIYLSPELVERSGIYILSFDRPGYGESDPNPKRTVKSMALDIEELADQLRLGSKLAGATLIAPAVNYWWSGLPTNLSNQAYQQQLPQNQWVLRVAHYAPWLTYWRNTQKWFPFFSVLTNSTDHLASEDIKLLMKMPSRDHIVLRQLNYAWIVRNMNSKFDHQ
ncbi:germin-like protein subfamily 3 member 2-like [Hibiscus syriacus]|uniref:Germin-like protein subfamily 3 member 2-like n=1 Tax=Hibiscus syriacus TaxID=106335 RepID=A0A6A3B2Z6_HIBSY|nr:germin-like protein subfamily 3 member 2-like [Hibiscus syriacus]